MFSCFVLCSKSLLRSEIEHLLHLPFFINVSCAFPCSFKFCSYYFCYTAIPSSIADQNCLITFVLLRHSLQYVRVPISVKTGKTPNLQPANKFTVGVIGTHAQTILFACSIIIGVCVSKFMRMATHHQTMLNEFVQRKCALTILPHKHTRH